jgi:hypothetical protein
VHAIIVFLLLIGAFPLVTLVTGLFTMYPRRICGVIVGGGCLNLMGLAMPSSSNVITEMIPNDEFLDSLLPRIFTCNTQIIYYYHFETYFSFFKNIPKDLHQSKRFKKYLSIV